MSRAAETPATRIRVPAHLTTRIEKLMAAVGWDRDHTDAMEAACRQLLAGAVQEAELAGPELWLASSKAKP